MELMAFDCASRVFVPRSWRFRARQHACRKHPLHGAPCYACPVFRSGAPPRTLPVTDGLLWPRGIRSRLRVCTLFVDGWLSK